MLVVLSDESFKLVLTSPRSRASPKASRIACVTVLLVRGDFSGVKGNGNSNEIEQDPTAILTISIVISSTTSTFALAPGTSS